MKKLDSPKLEEASLRIADILHERTCIVKGCSAKWHVEDANVIIIELQKMKLIGAVL